MRAAHLAEGRLGRLCDDAEEAHLRLELLLCLCDSRAAEELLGERDAIGRERLAKLEAHTLKIRPNGGIA